MNGRGTADQRAQPVGSGGGGAKRVLWILATLLLLLLVVLVFGMVYFLLLPSPPPGPAASVPAAQLSEALQGQVWRIERIIDLLTLMMAVGAITVGFGGLIGYSIVRDWIGGTAQNIAETYAKRAADDFHNDALARFMAEESYIHWRISNTNWRLSPPLSRTAVPELSDAISQAERALREIDRIREPEDPNARANLLQLRTNLRTNLAYYYAEAQIRDKEDVARRYARWARRQMNNVSHPEPSVLIANDLYVQVEFGNSQSQLEATRKDLLRQLEVYEGDRRFCDELREYQARLDKKIKDLWAGP